MNSPLSIAVVPSARNKRAVDDGRDPKMGDLGAVVGIAVDDNESRLGVLKGGDGANYRCIANCAYRNG